MFALLLPKQLQQASSYKQILTISKHNNQNILLQLLLLWTLYFKGEK
jgi:hypothetical protein